MKKKLIIVGGGITGCALALHASENNFEVSIYEKSNSLGGILSDVQFGNDLFFQNCQYLNSNNMWFKKIIKNNFTLKNFFHQKYSFSNLENNEKLVEDIAGVPTSENIEFKNLNIDLENIVSLKDKLKLYPNNLSSKIFEWLKISKIDTSDLSHISSDGLGLKRVFPQKKLNSLLKLKKKNRNYDDLFGLPNKFLYSRKIFASLPPNGFNELFSQISKKLKKQGVKIFLNSIVKPEWHKDLLKIKHKREILSSDYFFWSGNPTGLIKSYGLPLLDSKHLVSKNFFFNLSGKISNNFYIQIYDMNTPISRLFIYRLKNMIKLTVETNSNKLKTIEVQKYCIKIFEKYFKKLKLKIKKNSNFTKELKKYVLVSNKDFKIINQFNNKTKKTNLITGSWLKYSRDDKIEFAIKNLETK